MANISRTKIWHYVLNEGGQPIENAEIRLYLQDSPTTEAVIYASENGSATTCSTADIKTDNDGYFEFWLEGETGSGGYAHKTEFILEWFKAGTAPGYVYNYNPWPNALVWRDTDTGADVTNENKFISNFLAEKWYGHTNDIVPSASPHDLHPVDYESGCDDDTYNKIVSNKFLYDITIGSNVGDTFDLNTIYGDVQEYQELISSWTTSGSLYYKDITHVGIVGDTIVRMTKTNGNEEIVPAEVIRLGVNQTRVAIDQDIEAWVTIQGGSSSSSQSSSSVSISSSSSSSSTSTAPAWVSVFDNTRWKALSNGFWNGSEWQENGPGMSLDIALGATWQVGFIPTKVRVTYSGAGPAQIAVGLAGGGNDFGFDNSYTSGDELDLTVTSDIVRINVYLTTRVQNIEFLGGTLG